MSYILDSIKKSDQERSGIDLDAPEQLKTAPYLDVPEPKPSVAAWVYVLAGFIVACVFMYIVFLATSAPKIESNNTVLETPTVTEPVAVSEPVVPKPIVVVEQKKSEVDALYQTLDDQVDNNTVTSAPLPETDRTDAAIPSPSQANTTEPLPTKTQAAANKTETELVEIPSIFSFDAAIQRNIPDIDYGAHIYASDNNSGFVILNGSKKHVGDSLRSGIYIEKINEEDVVLSYNGLLFTLPALKSWSYQ